MDITPEFEDPTVPLFSWCKAPEHPMNKSQILLDDHFGVIIGYIQVLIAAVVGAAGKWLIERNYTKLMIQ